MQKTNEAVFSDPNSAYFTQNWFYQMGNDTIWPRFMPSESETFRYLEVGSFQGMSAHWVAKTYPLAKLTCIDTFEGSVEHQSGAKLELQKYFDHNLKPFKKRVTKKVGYSNDKLRSLPKEHYHVIYLDGDHHARAVLEDAVLAFPLLKTGGIMIFDDYEWHPQGEYSEFDCPKMGIAAFLALYRGHYDVIHQEYQVIIKKKEFDVSEVQAQSSRQEEGVGEAGVGSDTRNSEQAG